MPIQGDPRDGSPCDCAVCLEQFQPGRPALASSMQACYHHDNDINNNNDNEHNDNNNNNGGSLIGEKTLCVLEKSRVSLPRKPPPIEINMYMNIQSSQHLAWMSLG